ncbi:negative elongation factor A-like isoform X2 [Dermacentor albipictus]|uniref:negative elongation factor A-like isoform X2 n=1 Tax=Dermacentor albipictus TaxID=60249 RepID=UPI0038FCDE8C
MKVEAAKSGDHAAKPGLRLPVSQNGVRKIVRFKMAYVRDSDTSLWLHNKLGTSNDLWSGYSICSQLNQDVLKNIRECFIDLQSQVKLKLLLSFLHIPRRNVEEWKAELEDILEVASADSDQWVSMLAELLRSFPGSGTLNFNIEENSGVFVDLCNDLRKLVKKHADKNILPLECLYLNKHALTALVGQLPQPVKHFALKRKPKSAALRAELLQKSQDALSNAKRNTSSSSVPIRCRGLTKNLNDSSPLRGIPSRVPTGGFKTPTSGNRLSSGTPLSRSLTKPLGNKKDGGIKLLDINEQPLGYGRDAKRRKKPTEEIPEMQKKDKEAPTTPTTSAAPVTPDYAAGLLSSSQYRGLYFPCVHPTFVYSLSSVPASPAASYGIPATSTALPAIAAKTNPPLQASGGTGSQVGTTTKPGATLEQGTAAPAQPHEAMPPSTSVDASTGMASAAATVVAPTTSTVVTVAAPPNAVVRRTTATIGELGALNSATTTAAVQHIAVQKVQPVVSQQTAVVVTTQPQQRVGLSLSLDQVSEAQEMFKNSNKVSRSEKALILGFMAGSRANPCPELGNLITIRLSENKEEIVQPNGTVKQAIVETHFQMNYTTGEWKRVRKIREVED